ncbi:hypothetical protein SAM23877_2601 [Streptomyces ambofaciens ATCC 23877]|uniref:Uncharacterized protein n=1 Tax=Streptomyces ambofaciens (strain ATCC 23877 / 3486 / DSM 40053 / JCM 4204 / NBRC 12836 / NRRL B-2516) TaxID=278992 RepID=A0A0K2AR99_STRA7|nr:hypothetical protein SAM23877_2601 [Streptomyces ambofaciens ATCC 23877]
MFLLALTVDECQTSPAQCTAVGYAPGKAGATRPCARVPHR